MSRKESDKLYYEKNKEKIKAKRKEYIEKNKERIKEYQQEYIKKNKEKIKEYNQEYYIDNKERINQCNQNWVTNNQDKKKNYYNDNKEYYKDKNKEWRENNKEHSKKYRREYEVDRIKNDDLYKITNRVRNIIGYSIKKLGYKKTSKSQVILGCSFDEFKLHIESKFESWMNWDNYGNPKDGIYELNKTWDIDHIIPLSSAKTEEDIVKLNHYTNLQPLCSYTNRFIKKGNI